MTILGLLSYLAERDIQLWLEEGNLRYSAPEGGFTAEVRDLIVARKAEVVEFLAAAQKFSHNKIACAPRDQILPLSFAQQRMWVLQQLDPDSTAYNIHTALRVEGVFNPLVLEAAFRALICRHEILRTRYVDTPDQAIQIIDSEQSVADWCLQKVDLSQCLSDAQTQQVEACVQQQSAHCFDLSKEWPIRAQLIQLSSNKHIIVVTQHHIASDGWSMGVLVKELIAFYHGLQNGSDNPSVLPPLPIQYADFALWQRDWLQGDLLAKQIDYWREQLADSDILELPADHSRLAQRSTRGASIDFSISATLKDRIQTLARQKGVTAFQWLLAAYAVFLNKYSGQSDLCIGSPVANRNVIEIESLIGFFVNTLAFRIQWQADLTFNELLASVHRVALDAYAHQDVPFERLVEALQVSRDMSHTPLFQTVFVLQNQAPVNNASLDGLKVFPLPAEATTAKFDLTLGMVEVDQGYQASFEYSTDLFEANTIEQMAQHFQNTLQALVENSDALLSQIDILSAPQREALLSEIQPSAAYCSRQECLHELFEQRATSHPEAIAVTCDGKSLTYNQLNEQANRLAHWLLAKQVKPDTLVGICVDRSLTMMIHVLAVLKAGAAYLPIDPSNPQDRIAFILEDALQGQDSKIVLSQASVSDLIPASLAEVWPYEMLQDALTDCSTHNPMRSDNHSANHRRAYVIYTSGTTGKPKGVVISHGNVIRLFASTDHWFRFSEQGPSDVWTLFHSFAFDFSVWEIWGALLHGGRLVVVPYSVSRSPQETYQLLVDEGVTVLNQTPSSFAQLIQVDAMQPQAVRDRLKLREVIFGGEALDFTALKQWRRHHQLTQPRLINMYGITETTVHVTYYPIQDRDLDQRASLIGKPIPDLQTIVLDAFMNLVPIGVAGELYVGGAGLAGGYLHRQELTNERFIENPFFAGARLYKTGDKVRRLVDGNLEYLGRMDDQVKIRGFRIELGEIESVVLQHASVQDAIVMVRDDESGEKRLVAYVVSTQQDSVLLPELKALLKQHLPEYMVPTAYKILDQLPLTGNGKINKKALPVPDQFAVITTNYVAPNNELEQTIVAIWQDLLKIERIGVHDNFFDLGGHSIIATRVISRIREQLHIDVPLKSVFQDPTVRGIANAIECLGQEQILPIVPMHRDGDIPLSYAQQRLWILDQFDSDSSAYNMPGAVRIHGLLNHDCVQKTLQIIIQRHEILRTTFQTRGESAVQIIHPIGHAEVQFDDVRHLPSQQQEAIVHTLISEQVSTSYDLTTGPLFNVRLIQLNEDHHVLVICMHHIISDGWSVGVLVNEFSKVYDALSHAQDNPLQPLPIQYADYALWQRQWLQGDTLDRQLTYWKKQLNPDGFILDLPTDFDRYSQGDIKGAVEEVTIDTASLQVFKQLINKEGATLFMGLLSVLNLVLHRYAGQDEINVGTPIAGRNRSEIEGLIGFFINTLVMNVDLSSRPTFRELVRQVKTVALGAYAHQDIPFEKLVEELKPERDLSRTPLFQVFFNVINLPESNNDLSGLTLESIEGVDVDQVSKFDLTIYAKETTSGLNLSLVYNANLFLPERIQRLLQHFEMLFKQVALLPDQLIHEYDLSALSERARQAHLVQPMVAQPQPHPVKLFQQRVEQLPQAIALQSTEFCWQYQQVDQVSNAIANALLQAGIKPGDTVAIMAQRSVALPVALLGVMKARAAFVIFDQAYPAQRIADCLDSIRVFAVLRLTDGDTSESLCTELESLFEKQSAVFYGVVSSCPECNVSQKKVLKNLPDWVSMQDDLGYVSFTSGSTGKPKAIANTLAPLAHFLQWYPEKLAVSQHDRFSMVSGLAHDPLLRDIFVPFVCGATLCVPESDYILDADALHQWFLQQGITVTHLTPALAQLLMASPFEDTRALNTLKSVILGGDQLAPAIIKMLNQCAPNASLWNAYGATETPQIMSLNEVRMGAEKRRNISLGCAVPNVDVLVLNEARQLAAIGESGEIAIRTPYLANGYMNDPRLSASRFVQNPYCESADRLYLTGDKGCYLESGAVAMLGRIDDQIKVRGYRVEPAEIKGQLEALDAVRQAAVLMRASEAGEQWLVAYIVANSDDVDTQALRTALSINLPDYMIPMVFICLDSLPLTPNGKLDKSRLPPPSREFVQITEYVSPSTDTEKAIAAIWQQVLNRDDISIKDNFFHVGGHSLLAVRVVARVREQYAVEFSIKVLFDVSTIEGMAKFIDTTLWLRDQSEVSAQSSDELEEFEL